MKKYGAIFMFTILVISFQNCSQPGVVGSSSADLPNLNEPPQTASSNKASLELAEQMIITNNFSLSGLKDEAYAINLQNGSIIPGSLEPGSVSKSNQQYCATEEQIKELKALLSVSEVCVPTERVVDPKQLCTMEYKYPYATLLSENLELKLGEKKGGCDEPVELCGQQKDVLRGWISHLLSQLKKQTCSFEVI